MWRKEIIVSKLHVSPQAQTQENDDGRNVPEIQPENGVSVDQLQAQAKERGLLWLSWMCAKVWLHVVYANMPSCLLSIAITSIYFLPGHLIKGSMRGQVVELMHTKFHTLFQSIFIFSAYFTAFEYTFSVKVMRRGYIFCCGPLFLMTISFGYFVPGSHKSLFMLMMSSELAAPLLMMWMIKSEKRPANLNQREELGYQMTKDGTPAALIKGWFLFFLIMLAFSLYFPHYIRSSFEVQLCSRLFAIPLAFFLVNFGQQLYLVGLSMEGMDRRLVISVCTNQFLQFIGRFMVSNVSSSSDYNFVLLTIGLMFVEILSRASFLYRYVFYKNFKYWLRERSAPYTSKKIKYVTDMRDAHEPVGDASRFPTRRLTVKTLPPFVKELRARQIMDEMATEVSVLIIVPVLMYLFKVLTLGDGFEPIREPQGIAYQIIIQLVCEGIGDIIALLVEVWYYDIPVTLQTVQEKDPQVLVKVTVTMVAVFFCQTMASGALSSLG